MILVPYYVLDFDEAWACLQVKPFAGYLLEGEARSEEVSALGCLFRRNDPMRVDKYDAAYFALTGLRKRLADDANNPLWTGDHEFMANLRRLHADVVQFAIDALPHPTTLEPLPIYDHKYEAI